MNWILLTPADLDDTKIAALVNACRTAALGEGQADPIPGFYENAINRVRDEISTNPSNRLDRNESKIPKGLKDLTLRMIMRMAQSRLKIALTKDEETEQSNDLKYLERIARGGAVVLTPDDPIEAPVESGGAPFEVVHKPKSLDRDMGGLL